MRESLDNLLRQYEDGKLTRRQVLGAITALAVPARAGAQPGRFRARSLHHVNVGVTDVAQSEAFYRTLLGVPARRYIVGDAYALEGVRLAGPTSVLVPDPDGVIVQLSSHTERFEGTPPNRGC